MELTYHLVSIFQAHFLNLEDEEELKEEVEIALGWRNSMSKEWSERKLAG